MTTLLIIAYLICAVLACWFADRAARKHRIKLPNILWTCVGVTFWGMAVLLVFWPFIMALITWSEISSRQARAEFQRELEREREERERNPYFGLPMEEQIDRLGELHQKLAVNRRPEAGREENNAWASLATGEPHHWGSE